MRELQEISMQRHDCHTMHALRHPYDDGGYLLEVLSRPKIPIQGGGINDIVREISRIRESVHHLKNNRDIYYWKGQCLPRIMCYWIRSTTHVLASRTVDLIFRRRDKE